MRQKLGGAIVADRYVDYVPLDQVKPAVRNPKGHDAAGISRSINHHGLAELPLLDERTGRLVAGHGRHEQLADMRATNQPAPDGIRVDDNGIWHMPVIRGWASRSDADADAYGVASNRLVELGGWDERELAAVLSSLDDLDLVQIAGYTPDDLDELLRSTDSLGEAATAFLGDVISPPASKEPGHTDPDADNDLDDVAPGPRDRDEPEWVPVSWLVPITDRVDIRAALAAAQRRWGLDTAALALAALARHFLESEPVR